MPMGNSRDDRFPRPPKKEDIQRWADDGGDWVPGNQGEGMDRQGSRGDVYRSADQYRGDQPRSADPRGGGERPPHWGGPGATEWSEGGWDGRSGASEHRRTHGRDLGTTGQSYGYDERQPSAMGGGHGHQRRPHLIGKGPKGYQRSDARIQEEVSEKLSHGFLDASDIEVTVQNGEVILQGTVETKADRRIAEDVIEEVSGVRDIDNRLKVKRGGSTGEGIGHKERMSPVAERQDAQAKGHPAGGRDDGKPGNGHADKR
jgi:hypothetical protein